MVLHDARSREYPLMADEMRQRMGADSRPEAESAVGRAAKVLPAVVLVFAAVRAVAAMATPALREPGWPDVGLLVISVVVAGFLFATQRISIPRMGAALAVAAFWLSPWATALIHGDPLPIASVAMAAAVVVFIAAPPRVTALVRTAVTVGAIIVAVSLAYGLATAVGALDGAFHSVGDYERTAFGVQALRGITLHPNTLGPIAAVTLLLSLLVTLAKDRWVTWLIPVLCMTALLWSQSRAAIAGAVLAILAAVVVAKWERLRGVIVGLALLMPLVPFLLFTPLAESLPIEDLFNRIFTGRQVPWLVAQSLFEESPITGYGTQAFSREFWDQGPDQWWNPLHAHNEILEAAAQAGLIGVATLAGIALTAAITILSRQSEIAYLAAALLVLSCVQAVVEVPLGVTYFPISYLFPMLVVAGMAFQGELGWRQKANAGPRGPKQMAA